MVKLFWVTLGSTSVLAGLLIVWTPVPLGLPLLMVGLPLLMKYSPQSRDSVQRLAEHFPRLFMPLRRLLPLDKDSADSATGKDDTADRND